MAKGSADPPRAPGAGLLVGAAIGTVVVLVVFATLPGAFHWSISPARSGKLAELSCGTGQCINVTLGFTGPTSLDPHGLRAVVVPINGTEIVNGSSRVPLNLTFEPAGSPHWVGNLGAGHTTTTFEAEIVNPGGTVVGTGGAGAIARNAVFCLKSTYSTTNYEFDLEFVYDGVSVEIPFAIA